MRTARWLLLCLAAPACLALSCADRPLSTGNPERECWDLWDCNPGRLCGEMVDCVHFHCQRDATPVLVPCPSDECVRDADCVVALPFDCCNGCPAVTARDALPDLPCHHAADDVAADPPLECLVDCFRCPACFPQPLAARCVLGRCVSQETGCPSTLDATPPEVSTSALLRTPDAYDGATVLLVGSLMPGPLSCLNDCAPGQPCCSGAPALDGVVTLVGRPCDVESTLFADDACSDHYESAGLRVGATYAVAGQVHRTGTPEVPFEIVVDGLWLRSGGGIEGAFDFIVTEIESDASDPSCLPPSLDVGTPGRIYLAEDGGRLVAAAPRLDCWPRFEGASEGPGRFSARAPVYCDSCCCDYVLSGEVVGNRLYGQYESFDGLCRHRYLLEGVRDPLPQPLPPASASTF